MKRHPSNAIPAAGTTFFTYTGHTGPVISVAWSRITLMVGYWGVFFILQRYIVEGYKQSGLKG